MLCKENKSTYFMWLQVHRNNHELDAEYYKDSLDF